MCEKWATGKKEAVSQLHSQQIKEVNIKKKEANTLSDDKLSTMEERKM